MFLRVPLGASIRQLVPPLKIKGSGPSNIMNNNQMLALGKMRDHQQQKMSNIAGGTVPNESTKYTLSTDRQASETNTLHPHDG